MRIFLVIILFGMSTTSLLIRISVLLKEDKLSSKNWYFFMICICGSAWNLRYLLIETAANSTDMNFGRSIALAGGLGASCILTKFISGLVDGNVEKKSNITIIVTIIGLMIFPLIASSDNIKLIETSNGIYYSLETNPITIIYSIYCVFIILVNLIITIKWIKVSKYKRDKFQGKIIAVCILFSAVGVFGIL